jgi:Mg2+ and Co2+ transporter CorA
MEKRINQILDSERNRILEMHKSATDRMYLKNQSEELEEGIFSGAKDFYRGVKGMKRGEGMDYFRNLSALERLVKKLKKLDQPNTKVMLELQSLKTKVSSTNMPQDKKKDIVDQIDKAVFYFNNYQTVINQIENNIKGKNLDSW